MQATEQKSQVTDFEPDVWWGPNGIDALIWADGQPYAVPLPAGPVADTAPDAEHDHHGEIDASVEQPCP